MNDKRCSDDSPNLSLKHSRKEEFNHIGQQVLGVTSNINFKFGFYIFS